MSATGAILVLVEHEAGAPAAASLLALAMGGALAASIETPLEAVAFGEGAASLAPALGAAGVAVLHVSHDDPGPAGRAFDAPGVPGAALAGLLAARAPRVVLAAGTIRGQETLAHAAALGGAPFAAGCTAVRPAGVDRLEVTRLRWGGSVLEEASLVGPTACVSIADGGAEPRAEAAPPAQPALIAASAQAAGAAAPTVRLLPSTLVDQPAVRLVGHAGQQAGGVALASARVVVGGGRGVGGPEGFRQIEELASLLGAAIGVSRVVTSAGWRPHAEQVGQTGTRISPDLYIACGISGAIQHIVACRGARAILAINTDPEAPIMARASHAVIGDLHEVVPALIAELRSRGVRPA